VALPLPATDYPPLLARLVDEIGWAPLLLTCLVLLIIGLVGLGLWRRDLLIRALLWLPARLFYRIRIHGRENVPATGAVLLVSNHVSFIDAVLVYWAQPRPVRFIVFAPLARAPGIRLAVRFAGAIPIDPSAGPRAIIQSLREAAEALARGEVVCIFAEGGISRTGLLLPFHRGMEQILKHTPTPVVPVCLDHVWGSIFSYRGGRFFWKLPQRIPYPVTISFGTPMPATTRAVEARQAIQKLSADSSVARAGARCPVHRQFVRMAARHPFRPCIIDTNNHGKVMSYGAVLAGSMILVKRLEPIVREDTMVGLWLPPSLGGAVANIALTFLGKVPVNLNYTSSPQVVQSAVKQCDIRHILTSRLFSARVPLEVPDAKLVYLEDFRKGISNWERLRTFATVVVLPGFVIERWLLGLGKHRPGGLATVIFSSGSTGDPKGVMLTHSNLSANSESVIQAIDPGPRDRLLGILPFFHSFGFTVTLWVPLQVGASLVYHTDPKQGKEVGELCRKYRCTILLTTPTFLRLYLKRSQPEDFATLRVLMCGAEKLPTALAKDFRQKFGVQPLEGYGCTELSPVAAANVPDWQAGSVRQIGNKAGTIGQPIPGVAARVVQPETFAPVPAGTEGLLLIYGANVMQGYLGRPEETRDVIRDGWYVTGDIAKFDEEGFITLTDRLSRFSKIGGEMVPHQKIEDELHDILKTSERICVVTAVPDERRGERLIVLHTALNGVDEQQLAQQLGSRGLPNLWLPSPRDFFLVPELPVLGTGKVDLKRVKELAEECTRR
jgi:acyl-[acyl-carrier-protein]-phospholipid O-acyltransferase/long-chain-fatty-acid--[acyl-carrier-protein] ligase